MAIPTPQGASARIAQGGGYLPPNASQFGYYHHVFHPHQPVYMHNSLPSQGFDPRFQAPLTSYPTVLAQQGYPPAIDQSGRQQETRYLPPHIPHPAQPDPLNSHYQQMDRSLSTVEEPLSDKEDTPVQGGKRGVKRQAANQTQKDKPKKAKQPAAEGANEKPTRGAK